MGLLYLLILVTLEPFTVLTLAISSPYLQPPCPGDERAAVLNFKQSFLIDCAASAYHPTAIPKVKKSWQGEMNCNCCLWDGVECDKETGRVIGLNLSNSWVWPGRKFWIGPNRALFGPQSTVWALFGQARPTSIFISGANDSDKPHFINSYFPSTLQCIWWTASKSFEILLLNNNKDLAGFLPQFNGKSPLKKTRSLLEVSIFWRSAAFHWKTFKFGATFSVMESFLRFNPTFS